MFFFLCVQEMHIGTDIARNSRDPQVENKKNLGGAGKSVFYPFIRVANHLRYHLPEPERGEAFPHFVKHSTYFLSFGSEKWVCYS